MNIRVLATIAFFAISIAIYSQTSTVGENKPAASKKYPFNGMGRIIIKSDETNVGKQPFLTQADFTNPNTVYVICYDCMLVSDVVMPEGCVLQFDGGSISGKYKITGTNTGINANVVQLFGVDVTLVGTWNVNEAYTEWFGAKGDGITDDKDAIQKTLESFNNISFLSKSYHVDAKGRDIVFQVNHPITIKGVFETSVIHFSNIGNNTVCFLFDKDFVDIENIFLRGDSKHVKGTAIKHCNTNRKHKYGRSLHLNNVKMWYFHDGLIANSYLNTFKWVECAYCVNGFFIGSNADTDMTSNTLICCFARDCSGIGYNFNRLIYSSIISCAADNCSTAYNIYASENLSILSCGCENSIKAFNIRSSFNIGIYNQRIYNAKVLDEGVYNRLIDVSTCWEVTFYSLQRSANDVNKPHKFITVGSSAKKNVPCVRFAYCYDTNLNIYEAFINNGGLPNNIEFHSCDGDMINVKHPNFSFIKETGSGSVLMHNKKNLSQCGTIRPDTSSIDIGYMFFDTAINKPIYWTGDTSKGDGGWVDALGNHPRTSE